LNRIPVHRRTTPPPPPAEPIPTGPLSNPHVPRQGHHLSKGGLVLLAVVVVLAVVAFGAVRGVLNRPVVAAAPASASRSAAPSGTLVQVNIRQGETTAEIAKDLEDKGLIPNDTVFLGMLKLRGSGSNFQPGIHEVRAGTPMEQLADELSQPVAPKEVRITLPEGRRLEEDAAAAATAGIGTAEAFTQLADHPDPSWNYDFLADLPKGASLEGFLFPDTYQLPASPQAADLIKRQLDDFQRRVTPDVRQQIASQNHKLYDTLIVASIVEREAKAPEERPLIAGVYWNRLKRGMGLFADPTVQYAVGKPGNWWPNLSANDLKVNSPYNTYIKQGLPPGPICNPGLASIQAAANPQGDYLYFVAKNDGSGQHAFARTLDEHNANRAKYGQ